MFPMTGQKASSKVWTCFGVSALMSLSAVWVAPLSAQELPSPAITLCASGCVLAPAGLIGWWPGDGNAHDIQLGSNGTPMGGAGFAPGRVDRAFSFDGINAFIDVPDTQALHVVATAVTVTAWIKPRLSPTGAGFVLAHRDPEVSDGFSLFINNDGYLRAQLQTDSFLDIDSTNPVIQFNGEWQHIALTADSTTGKVTLYLNGEIVPAQVEAGGAISGFFADVTHTYIGQRQGSDTVEGAAGALNFKGLIDEVEVFNRALSPEELRSIFRAGAKGNCKPNR